MKTCFDLPGEHRCTIVLNQFCDVKVPIFENNVFNFWCFCFSFEVAIVIPYRKRQEQLKVFLRHMHPMLTRQLLDYRIMVIEQVSLFRSTTNP